MIQEQIILSGSEKSLAELTTAVNNGDYDYILLQRQFLYYTKDAGIVIVNVDKTITLNPAIQLGDGLQKASNGILIDPATDSMIDDKTSDSYALTPKHLNYAVKSALTATNGITFTADDLTKVKSLFQLHKIATSGSYNDLVDKPVTATSSVEGFTKLYAEIGDNTDGTLTQAAIKSELSKKAGSGDAYTKSQSDAKYVVKVEGKGLSSNDYTLAEKTKLEGIENGANKYVLPSDVVKDANYVHTDTNFTTADKAEVDKVASKADTSALIDYVKFTDYASSDKSGVIKFDPWYGLNIFPSGVLYVNNANTHQIADRDNAYKPIVPTTINAAVKAALSDAKRISDMTDEEKANARGVIDAIGPTDYASATKGGVVIIENLVGGLGIDTNGTLRISEAGISSIENRSRYKPITSYNLNLAVKAALTDSRRISGMTDEEKANARGVIGAAGEVEVRTTLENEVVKNCIYDLGEQTSLSITLPATGNVGDWLQFDFMSGSTATTLTIASTAGILGYDLIPEINTIYSLYLDWGMIGKSDTGSTYGWRFSYSEYPINM